jgi:phosphoglycerate dehydrogenase-like enzyme
VVSEATLIHALEENWLEQVVLDVFAAEPLPEESVLWEHPRVQITPHISAISYPSDIARVFVKNLEHWVQAEALDHVVQWENGY